MPPSIAGPPLNKYFLFPYALVEHGLKIFPGIAFPVFGYLFGRAAAYYRAAHVAALGARSII